MTRWSALAVALAGLMLAACAGPRSDGGAQSHAFGSPVPVRLVGYAGDAMEPFLTRDGRHLIFNNSNDPGVDTNLHYAERIDDFSFRYRGELQGVNTQALDAVASIDRQGNLYFVSTRSYDQTLGTLYRGHFRDGRVTDVELLKGVSRNARPMINFDAEISPDGETLWFVDARFGARGPETADLVVARREGREFRRLANSDQLLARVNTPALEYAPCISADGRTLIFTRAEFGLRPRVSLYIATRRDQDSAFGDPALLVDLDGFVEAATLSPDARLLYFHKKDNGRYVIMAARSAAP